MSSESSDGGLFTSQESDAKETPSCSHNTPINEFASLNLADNQQIPVWRPQADSDYDSDYGADTGKRKQRSQESETRDSKKKKLRANEEMECDEEVVKNSEEPMQKQEANEARASHKNESDEETKDEEDSENENNEESDKEWEVMVQKPIPDLIDNLPSTSRLKRKWDEQAESVTAPKMFRPEDSEEDDSEEEDD